uniref:C2H2-type domain-containing protein n=1 Tax=Globodera pallida TaxID=36090 RepID=A0A183BR41_GLOPA
MPTNHKKAPKIASSEALGDEADGRGGAEGSSRTSLVPSSGGVDAGGKKKKSNKKKKKKAPPFADNDGTKVPKKNVVAGEEEEDSFGEKNKHRNSLTDSPLTGLSPSSATSNGDSADDTEVRLLMWYGADISLCHSCNAFFDPLQLSLCANPNSSVQHWLADRVDALSSKIRSFVRRLCARCFSVRTALSPVHFVRFGGCWSAQRNNSQILRNCQLNLRANANRSSCSTLTQLLKQNAKSKIILFIVPVSFRTADKFSAASDPKIVHVEFPDNAYIVSTSVMYNSQTPAKALNNTVLSRKHNSHFYAFELSSSSCVEGLHKLMLNIKSNTGFSDDSRAVLLAIQAYLCVEQPTEIDNDGNNNNGNSGQRAKEKAKLD